MVDLVKSVNQPQTQVQAPVIQPQAPSRDEVYGDLALAQHVIQFFGDKDMKAYNDFYGPTFDDSGIPYLTGDHLIPGQAANRQRVLIEADRIIAGASLQGEQMPIQQALAMAHMIVAEPMVKQIARNELVAQVKQKAKGVTLRPSARKATVPPRKDGEGKTEAELEKDTEARLRKIREGKSPIM